MTAKKRATRQPWVDPDEVPELTEEFFQRADVYIGERLIRRGRPPLEKPKRQLTVRYDADIVDAFKAGGPGWQTRMNDALREWLARQPPPKRTTTGARARPAVRVR